mgnify:CR=1 FL=1
MALKDGTLSGKKMTDDDITDLKTTKHFRQRHSKCLRKEIRPPNIICDRLDQWHARFKCLASEGSSPALGRLDPVSRDPLFTAETKTVLINCKDKCKHLQDPLPLDQMYDATCPNPNSPHGLKECLSRRGESNLESFHLMLAHFGNTGMRESLADNLNLTGTARHNLSMRHKLRLSRMSRLTDENTAKRSLTPAGWETTVDCYNHSELNYVNKLAKAAGISNVPFPQAERLPLDNGERFFSTCLAWLKRVKPKQDLNDLCLCSACSASGTSSLTETITATTQEPRREEEIPVDGPSNVAPPEAPQPTTNAIIPAAPTIPNSYFAAPWFQMPQAPVLWINPHMPSPNWNQCCRKCREHMGRFDKRGRPPHDCDCRFRVKSNGV